MGGLYTYKWQQARVVYLREHPLCVHCKAIGHLKAAICVDHIKPHRGDEVAFWDEKNWQPLCKVCHDTKTATEDGGLGNRRMSATDARKPRVGCSVSGMPVDLKHFWNR